MAKQQPVFEDVGTDARLYLSDLQGFASAENATITFKFGEEIYHVDAQQLTLSYLAHDSAPVDPLLAFDDLGGFPFIRRRQLAELPGGQAGSEPPFFRVERRKGGVGQLSLHGWRDMLDEMSRALGRDASRPPDTGLRALLEYRGGVPPEYLEVASRSVQPGETFGQALLRLDFATPRDLLFAALGGARLFNPTCHMANAIGRVLLEAGAISREDLEAAVVRQVASGKSLAAILHGSGACSGAEVAQALEKLQNWTIFLPPTDKMGEVLVKRGKISRTQLMSALFKIQGTDRKLGDYLVAEELATRQEVAEAEAWHDLKLRIRTAGKVRLGQILLEMQAISQAQLEKALIVQIDRGEPLGEILMSEGLCPPEAVIEGLLEQELRLNERVAAAIAGLDDGETEKLPLFDIPPSALKGKNKKKRSGTKGKGREADDADKGASQNKAGRGGKGGARDGLGERGTNGESGKGHEGSRGTRGHKRRKARQAGWTAFWPAGIWAGKVNRGKDGSARKAGSKGRPRGAREVDRRKALPWKRILGGAAAVALFGTLAYGTARIVGNLIGPGGPLAARPPAGAASAPPTSAPASRAVVIGSPAAGVPAGPALATAVPPIAMGPVAGTPPGPPGGPPGAGVPAALPGPGGERAGGIRQQAAAQSTLQGDRTTLSHLSNEELRRIAKKNPAFVTADDIEAKGGRIGEVLARAEKADPNFARAVAAARMTSGANLLNQELDNLENDAPGKLTVGDGGGAISGGAPSAQGQAQAAATFRSAQAGGAPGQESGEAPGQFNQALSGDLAPGRIEDPRKQVRAFAGAAPRAAVGQDPGPLPGVAEPSRGRAAGLPTGGTSGRAPADQARRDQPGELSRESRIPPGQLMQGPLTPNPIVPGQVAPGQVRPRGEGARDPLQPAAEREARLQAILDEAALREQLRKNPGDPGAANGLALAAMARGQPAEAEKLLRRAQAARPDDPVVNQNLAAALMAQRKDAAAVPLLRRSEAAFRARTATEVRLAQQAAARRDYQAAESRLRSALRTQTLTADAAYRLGTAYQRQGRAAQAKVYFRRAAEGYMGAGRLHASLGEIASRRGNRKMAIYEYKLAAKLDPRAGRPWYLLGKEALAQKKVAQAYKYFRTALQKEPRAPYAREVRALLAE